MIFLNSNLLPHYFQKQKRLNRKDECKFASLGLFFIKMFSLCVVISSTIIQGCTLEDETEDRIVIPLKDQSALHDSPLSIKFLKLTKKCTTGDMNSAPDVLSMYISSLPSEDVPEKAKSNYRGLLEDRYFFQRRDLNLEFEKCMQKATVSGNAEYRNYYLTRAVVSSRISQYYYAHSDYENGAYWALRVINLLGISKGYNIMGRVFVRDPKTVEIGARMLSESAKHDNTTASAFLSETVLFRNVFDIVSESEEESGLEQNSHDSEENSSKSSEPATASEDVSDKRISDENKQKNPFKTENLLKK